MAEDIEKALDEMELDERKVTRKASLAAKRRCSVLGGEKSPQKPEGKPNGGDRQSIGSLGANSS